MTNKRKIPDFKPAKMTGWYDPVQLGRTAVDVVISTIFGSRADQRLIQGLIPEGKEYYDFSEKDGDFWFDYIADVGDGFNSTYTMAHYLTEPELILGDHQTTPGEILIFGGDEVYPVASKKNYNDKLIGPYSTAKPVPGRNLDLDEPPRVFAVPGNHDWYDGLAEFLNLFCYNYYTFFGGWKVLQKRSYFAIKLPAGWWLFGTDMQLGSSLDVLQIDFFEKIVRDHFRSDDQIILCDAEPYWIDAALNPEFDGENRGYFEGRTLRRKVAVNIAGDRHYYRRHEEMWPEEMRAEGLMRSAGTDSTPVLRSENSRRHKIVAGGGGAFLHPTHRESVTTVGMRPGYKLKKTFPDEKISARIAWRTLLFPLWNWKFGLLTGLLYVLTARAFLSDLGRHGWDNFYPALQTVIHDTITQPIALFFVLAIFGGFVLFTDMTLKTRYSWIHRWIAGPIHGLVHLAGVFLVSWWASRLIDPVNGMNFNSIRQLVYAAILIYLGGFIAGPVIMGIYLFLSLALFGQHGNEAFSAIKIQDFKNFVRFKIEQNGDLVIYPIGVKKVIRNWRDGGSGERCSIMPVGIKPENVPFLIEEPIRYKKPAS